MSSFEQQLADLETDGKITEHDAFEARRFAAFLTDCGPSPSQSAKRPMTHQWFAALIKHYPEDPLIPTVLSMRTIRLQSRCRGR